MENETAIVAKWINEASLINRSALCKEIGIDRANLDKYLLKGQIPEQHLEKIKSVIARYGYVSKIKSLPPSANNYDAAKIKRIMLDEASQWQEPESIGAYGLPKGVNLRVSKKVIDIQAQIDELEMEKMPASITTPLGKKSWKFDQQKRINDLKKQL